MSLEVDTCKVGSSSPMGDLVLIRGGWIVCYYFFARV
jgi:hypothetical protein